MFSLFSSSTAALLISFYIRRLSITCKSDNVLSQTDLKRLAGYRAVDEFVRSGMKVGLGTGSTAVFVVERIGQKLKSGELTDIVAVPTSRRTEELAKSCGIPLGDLSSIPVLDVTMDGADEIDPSLNLIKGRGGALLREKMVAVCSKKLVIVADDSKLVKRLGLGTIPVEITPFSHLNTMSRLLSLLRRNHAAGVVIVLRPTECEVDDKYRYPAPYVTDNGNYIADVSLNDDDVVVKFANSLSSVVGVVEHGLFVGMADHVVVASAIKGVYILNKQEK